MDHKMKLVGKARSFLAPFAAILLATCLSDACAQGLPKATPEQVGLSSQRLASISDWLRSKVGQGKIPARW